MKFRFTTVTKKILADTITPVSIYLKARDLFPNSVLLESSDYHGNENSYSFICLQPVAWFKVENQTMVQRFPDDSEKTGKINNPEDFKKYFGEFMDSFDFSANSQHIFYNGLFGYAGYDAVQYFEKIELSSQVKEQYRIPELMYSFYRYIIAINHYKNELTIVENLNDEQEDNITKIESLIYNRDVPNFNFESLNNEVSNLTDKEYKSMVSKGKKHCFRGDVFQIVLSRQFSQQFKGDEFNVYRALRSINPSPYLFYFDYGSFKIFGSSPEAQLKVEKGKAYINPIAGTFKRTGDDEKDKQLAHELSTDIKENAEHVMLVDLARNDLSRHASDVKVESYREIQYYSHVIHMVSTVSGKLEKGSDTIDMMTATFPAGTLSGAPKYKAMQLIDKYENQNRGYYGGAIGMIGFNGNFNHAIMIRTFLSMNNSLFYQAGAGIVSVSKEENELQEVNNKLGALKKAILMAKDI